MNNTEQSFPQNLQIQGILDKYLNSVSNSENLSDSSIQHLDEDSLTVLVEGRMNRYEASNAVNHLINCSFCRHITAELIRLDDAFNDQQENISVAAESRSPVGISEVLSGLIARLFGSSEGAVFAHQEKNETDETDAAEAAKKAETENDSK